MVASQCVGGAVVTAPEEPLRDALAWLPTLRGSGRTTSMMTVSSDTVGLTGSFAWPISASRNSSALA